MIIDIHTHIFPNKIAESTLEKLSGISHSTPFTDGTLNGLINSMKKFNVDISVILPVATKPEQVIKINDNAAQINEKYFDAGIISFASIHPDFEDFRAELSRVKNLGFKGIKFHAEGFMRLFEIFGAEKILFGTDSPWMAQGTPIDFINSLPIGNDDKDKIFGGNAAKLLQKKYQ